MRNFKVTMMALMIGMAGVVWAGPVNVNTADAKTLAKELDGVGDKLAAAIVEERAKGPFKDAADLAKRVDGIGDAILKKNAANLRFSDK